MARTIRVAAVQVESRNGEIAGNLARAEPYVVEAARRGADLVVCPEFLAAGYIYDESIWSSAEPEGGPTEAWLSRVARANRVFVGATYLRVVGDDFYNTFALADRDGAIVGRVSKESLPAFEGWYFKSCDLPKYIDTELGRIGVGICHDNHTARFLRHAIAERPDLIVMPHSAPCGVGFRAIIRDGLTDIAPFYSSALGVPVVLVNKVGPGGKTPLPVAPRIRIGFDFPGLSTVVDSDGRVVERLADREGVVVADVALDPDRRRTPPAPSGYWSSKPRRFGYLTAAVFIALERAARRVYARSRERVAAARQYRNVVDRSERFTSGSEPSTLRSSR
jgi:N-carbamoylputrescine amidase